MAKNNGIAQLRQEEMRKFETLPTHSPVVVTSKDNTTNSRIIPNTNLLKKRGSKLFKLDKNEKLEMKALEKDYLVEYAINETDKYNNLGQVGLNPMIHNSKDFLKEHNS